MCIEQELGIVDKTTVFDRYGPVFDKIAGPDQQFRLAGTKQVAAPAEKRPVLWADPETTQVVECAFRNSDRSEGTRGAFRPRTDPAQGLCVFILCQDQIAHCQILDGDLTSGAETDPSAFGEGRTGQSRQFFRSPVYVDADKPILHPRPHLS